LCADHLVDLSRSLLEPTTLLAWGGMIALVAVAFFLAPRSPLLSFGVFWFLISYIPISNFIPAVYMLADRYMYIPSVGFCIVLVCLGEAMYQKLDHFKPRYAIPVMTVVGGLLIGGYSQKVLSYNTYWKNERVLWQYVLECNPESFRAYNNLGYQYLRAGSYPKAIELLSMAINLGFEKSYEHRGSAYIGMENYEAAMQDFNHALAYDPDWDTAYYGRGLVYFKKGQYEQAIDDFSRAIELKPDYSEAYNNRGLAYENLVRRDEALKDYFEATKLDPDNGEAHNNLGRALVYAGRLKEGIQSFQRAEKLGVTQATKILEILNKQGLPSDQ
jgi:tetratricopeptide (TPR) repeat protein